MPGRVLFSISLLLILTGLGLISASYFNWSANKLISPVINQDREKIKILDAYNFESLKIQRYVPREIKLADSNLFYFNTGSASVSGRINLPTSSALPKGIIILIRGYVDREI